MCGNIAYGIAFRLQLDLMDAADASFAIDSMALKSAGETAVLTGHEQLPEEFCLGPAYPNPFNPDTQFVCEVPERAHVRIAVFNLLGRELVKLADEVLEAGCHRLRWDGRSESGEPLASGVYLVVMQVPKKQGASWKQVRKVVLLQ